jgi:hypothetical protein
MPKAIYTSKTCLNPDCPVGEFIPSRSDKLYCDNFCKSRYHFLLRKELDKTTYKEKQELIKSDKTLKRLFKKCIQKKIETISSETLEVEGINLNTAVHIEKDPKTGFRIHWFFECGIMGVSQGRYKILKKYSNE